MDMFRLPDLGEGLPDAEIHEWHVKVGDTVKKESPLVSMETAKAVVDVPSPQDGIIATLYGNVGDLIKTGSPLVAFESHRPQTDQGTVVGNLESASALSEDNFIIGSASPNQQAKATPQVKLLAKRLGVDLKSLKGSGAHGFISREDVEAQARPPEGFVPLQGVRRAMQLSMVQAHQQVVPVSIFDEAMIGHWPNETDISLRLIRAIAAACLAEPALNAWFDAKTCSRKCFDTLNLGLAMDNEDGLFVPVIADINQIGDKELREQINQLKRLLSNRQIDAAHFKGASFTLSNFGKFSGRFASPIVVPPTVAILAVGKIYHGVSSQEGKIQSQRLLPLSLSFDHRAVTGGEATRFLGVLIKHLQA